MASVSITETPGEDFTWASSDFTWDSLSAERSWDDAHAVLWGADVSESLSLADALLKAAGHAIGEGLSITDDAANTVEVALSDLVAIAEGFGRQVDFAREIDESLGILDALGRIVAFQRQIDEGLVISEVAAKGLERPLAEAFAMADAMQSVWDYKRGFAETLTVADDLRRDTARRIAELIGFSEWAPVGYHRYREIDETIAIAEDTGKIVGKGIETAFALLEELVMANQYFINAEETIALVDEIAKETAMSVEETLGVIDLYMRNAQAVLSDLKVRTDGVDDVSFLDMLERDAPAGFEEFRQAAPGDYEYATAMFRAVLKAKTDDRAKLEKLRIVVDMEDIQDRGTVSIPAAATVVPFNRNFKATPEVQVTLKGGAVYAVPKIVTITTTDFTVELRDASNNLVAGSVSWSALGY